MLKKWFNVRGKIKKDKYVMKDKYLTKNLVVGNLEYISGDYSQKGSLLKRTKQRYIFEDVSLGDKKRYQEVFTGFVVGLDPQGYYEMPYIVNVQRLNEVLPEFKYEEIPNSVFIGLLDDVNKASLVLKDEESIFKKKKA